MLLKKQELSRIEFLLLIYDMGTAWEEALLMGPV